MAKNEEMFSMSYEDAKNKYGTGLGNNKMFMPKEMFNKKQAELNKNKPTKQEEKPKNTSLVADKFGNKKNKTWNDVKAENGNDPEKIKDYLNNNPSYKAGNLTKKGMEEFGYAQGEDGKWSVKQPTEDTTTEDTTTTKPTTVKTTPYTGTTTTTTDTTKTDTIEEINKKLQELYNQNKDLQNQLKQFQDKEGNFNEKKTIEWLNMNRKWLKWELVNLIKMVSLFLKILLKKVGKIMQQCYLLVYLLLVLQWVFLLFQSTLER